MIQLTFALLLVGAASSVFAAEGMIEINQVSALEGGVTTGDAAGFPVSINESGSYILTGNLTLPDADTTGIEISADNVTLDLGGFAIIGPVVCQAPPVTSAVTCTGAGTGLGITGTISGVPENVTVRNGTVQGVGATGIQFIIGNIDGIRAISNGGRGIEIGIIQNGANGDPPGGSITNCWTVRNGFTGINASSNWKVTDNVSTDNGGVGIACGVNCVISGNIVVANGQVSMTGTNGIFATQSNVFRNVIRNNEGFGLQNAGGPYSDNHISGNTGGTVQSGVDAGGNVCDGVATCP